MHDEVLNTNVTIQLDNNNLYGVVGQNFGGNNRSTQANFFGTLANKSQAAALSERYVSIFPFLTSYID